MAMFDRYTKCQICQISLGDDLQQIVAFRHFVRNKKDPLRMFSNFAFHKECIKKHFLFEKLMSRYNEFKKKSENRICIVCNNSVKASFLPIGFITDNPSHPLFKYNYPQVHIIHLNEWSFWKEFKDLIEEYEKSENYEGPPFLEDKFGKKL